MMDTLGNTSAYIYFALMAFALIWKAVTHAFCAWNMNTYRKLHVDEALRSLSRDMHGWMAGMALTMLWLHWVVLDYMVTFCATVPVLGFLAHMPLIVALYGQALNATAHPKRQRAVITARLA